MKPKLKKSKVEKPQSPNPSVDALTGFIREVANFKNVEYQVHFSKALEEYLNFNQPVLNAYDSHGQTPLTTLGDMDSGHCLTTEDFSESAFLLLNRGASPQCHNLNGKHFLSYIWNKHRKNFSFIEKYLEQGYSLGEFDLDVGDGIQELMSNCLFQEFKALGDTPFSLESMGEKSRNRLNFYFDYIHDKRQKGLPISANPFCIISRLNLSSFHTRHEKDFFEKNFEKILVWNDLCYEKGFDVSQVNAEGKTAVHYAIELRSFPLLEKLASYEANLFPDYFGTNIKDFAFSHQIYDYNEWALMQQERATLKKLPSAETSPRRKKL